jgi:hypothetical protein
MPAATQSRSAADLLADDVDRMPPERAKALLGIKLKPAHLRRVGHLLELNREGKISAQEREELSFLVQFNDFLGILQSTARLALKRSAPKSRRKSA